MLTSSSTTTDPVLQAVLDTTMAAVQAARGWVLSTTDSAAALEVVAGTDGAGVPVGTRVPGEGAAAGFCLSSGQPLAVVVRSPEQFPNDVSATGGGPVATSILCLPCEHGDQVTGVLQVADRAGGGGFTFDDLEVATLLAAIAGTALAHRTASEPDAPSPKDLGAALEALARSERARYVAVARLVATLLDRA